MKKSIEEAEVGEEFEENGVVYIKFAQDKAAIVLDENCDPKKVEEEVFH